MKAVSYALSIVAAVVVAYGLFFWIHGTTSVDDAERIAYPQCAIFESQWEYNDCWRPIEEEEKRRVRDEQSRQINEAREEERKRREADQPTTTTTTPPTLPGIDYGRSEIVIGSLKEPEIVYTACATPGKRIFEYRDTIQIIDDPACAAPNG